MTLRATGARRGVGLLAWTLAALVAWLGTSCSEVPAPSRLVPSAPSQSESAGATDEEFLVCAPRRPC